MMMMMITTSMMKMMTAAAQFGILRERIFVLCANLNIMLVQTGTYFFMKILHELGDYIKCL